VQGFIRGGMKQFCGFPVELFQAPVCGDLDVFFSQLSSQLMKSFGFNIAVPAL
jgi:hypothetical protein